MVKDIIQAGHCMQKSIQPPCIIFAIIFCIAGCSDSMRILRPVNGVKPSVALKIGITQSSQADIANLLLKQLSINIQSEASRNRKFTTTPDTDKAEILFEITIAGYSLATAESQRKFFNIRDSIFNQNARTNDSIENEFGDPTPKLVVANVIANAISLPFGFVSIVPDIEPPYQDISSEDKKLLGSTQACAALATHARLKSHDKSVLWEDYFDVRFNLYKPFADESQQQNLVINAVYELMQHVPIYKGAHSKRKKAGYDRPKL
jgi:hypothetical protein